MSRMHKLILLALVVPILMTAQTSSQDGPQPVVEKLASLLKRGAVGKVKVFHVRDSMETRVDIGKEALRTLANYAPEFNDQIPEKFSSLLSGLSAKKEDHTPDLRWGVFFYDAQGQEIGSVFVDSFGEHGYLNDQRVSFQTGSSERNLAKRLHEITGIQD